MGAVRSAVTSPVSASATSLAAGKPGKPSGGGFDDLWSMSLGSVATSKPYAPAGAGKSIRDLEKEKVQAGIWGTPSQSQARPPVGVSGLGSLTTAGSGVGGGPAGADDLLL